MAKPKSFARFWLAVWSLILQNRFAIYPAHAFNWATKNERLVVKFAASKKRYISIATINNGFDYYNGTANAESPTVNSV